MDVHLRLLDVLAALAFDQDIVVVLADDGGIDGIDDRLGDVFIEVAHRCPHLAPCVLLGQVLCMERGDAVAVDLQCFGQVEVGCGRHVWLCRW